jgi:hypothetical protein
MQPLLISQTAVARRGLAARLHHLARWSLPLVAAACLLAAYPAHASVIVNAPRYLGLERGLVGWWTFDARDMAGNPTAGEYAFDKSGNGNRGKLTNGPVRTTGRLGQGLQFDGSNDYVDVPPRLWPL